MADKPLIYGRVVDLPPGLTNESRLQFAKADGEVLGLSIIALTEQKARDYAQRQKPPEGPANA